MRERLAPLVADKVAEDLEVVGELLLGALVRRPSRHAGGTWHIAVVIERRWPGAPMAARRPVRRAMACLPFSLYMKNDMDGRGPNPPADDRHAPDS